MGTPCIRDLFPSGGIWKLPNMDTRPSHLEKGMLFIFLQLPITYARWHYKWANITSGEVPSKGIFYYSVFPASRKNGPRKGYIDGTFILMLIPFFGAWNIHLMTSIVFV